MAWFDNHCHLDDEGLVDGADAALARARAAGVGGFITIGTDAERSAIAIAIRQKKALHRESDTSDEDADLWIGTVLDRVQSRMRRFLHFA